MRRPRRSNTASPFKPGVEQGYPVLLAEATAQGADYMDGLLRCDAHLRRRACGETPFPAFSLPCHLVEAYGGPVWGFDISRRSHIISTAGSELGIDPGAAAL